ncbi:hypothetical protein [Cystobacter fuscus]|nr:hypothetical protein [Cystobacter fuscus]
MGSSEEVDPLAELREGEGSDAEAAATAAPPPLPPRRSTSVALRPAMTLPAVRMPARPSSSTGAADPFAEPTEPPAPPESSLPERLDYFRTVLRQKVETLQRARTLFAEREAELRTVRISETTLRGQLVEAQGQIASLKTRPASKDSGAAQTRVARLEAELLQVEEDRKDLSRSLADVEAELARLSDELTRERESRGALAEELIGAKEALSLAQDRVSELVTEHLETQGALEAVRDEYQSTLAELEQTAERLQEAERERELAAAERTGLSVRVGQLESLLADAQWSSDSLEEVRAHTLELEAARDGALAESGDLSEKLALAEAEVERLRERMESEVAALGEVVESAEANVARLEDELRTVTADRQDLSRALAEVEAELESLRSAKQVPSEETEEGAEEESAESRALEAEAQAERLRQRVKVLEDALETARRKNPAPAPAPDAEVIAERDQLREDVASMKRKLMVAELALETAASNKMKVARLEAELAQLKKAK